MAGKTRVTVKTKNLRGKSIVKGGAGTSHADNRPAGWHPQYAVEVGIIEANPAHGVRRPKDNVRTAG